MAQVPPADRTSPLLDPRFDPVFQRGYTPGSETPRSATPVRRRDVLPPTAAPAPSTGRAADPRPVLFEEQDSRDLRPQEPAQRGSEAQDAEPMVERTSTDGRSAAARLDAPATRRFIPYLFGLAGALVLAGIVFHFTTGSNRYAGYAYTASADGSIRFDNGQSLQEVLATELLSDLAPYLVVLGLATAIATVFLLAVRAGRSGR